ncbi:MAG: SsrA-binding protein [Candidatus Pelagibacter sp.]|nr:SsrA-binding protein [Candidatus Pelagibacter sp.]OUW11757.1 MAG: SsrA-binding protein [Candidatus Pelagibacter sp. TMED166]|tara:strand:+ start:48011 stop:48481 length:471 start_codon:yes stop_codon:yes gene_type:complete
MSKNEKKISNIVCQNRKASFNYFFQNIYEAGIELLGPEVKSLRSGKGNISESYALDSKGEIFLYNSYIPTYKESSYNNHEPRRSRKLLLKKKEISKLIGNINREGFAVVPTKIYFNKKGVAKVQIAVGKGKKQHDKRHTKKTRDWNREKSRIFRKN